MLAERRENGECERVCVGVNRPRMYQGNQTRNVGCTEIFNKGFALLHAHEEQEKEKRMRKSVAWALPAVLSVVVLGIAYMLGVACINKTAIEASGEVHSDVLERTMEEVKPYILPIKWTVYDRLWRKASNTKTPNKAQTDMYKTILISIFADLVKKNPPLSKKIRRRLEGLVALESQLLKIAPQQQGEITWSFIRAFKRRSAINSAKASYFAKYHPVE